MRNLAQALDIILLYYIILYYVILCYIILYYINYIILYYIIFILKIFREGDPSAMAAFQESLHLSTILTNMDAGAIAG